MEALQFPDNVSNGSRFPSGTSSLSVFCAKARNPRWTLAFRAFTYSVRVAAVLSMTEKSNPAAKSSKDGAGLEEARLRQQAIGVKLRHMFDEVVNEPVPDEFLDILRRADKRAGGEGA